MPKTFSYPSLVAEAKRSVAALAAELSAISVSSLADASAADGGSLGPARGGLAVPQLRSALRVANKAALAAGILCHGQLALLAASIRAFLHASASSPGQGDNLALDRGASLLKECSDAMDAAPEYAELVLPGGGALRPPLSRRVDVGPYCSEILKGLRPSLSAHDGRPLSMDGAGRYRILVSPKAAAAASSRGAWLSLSYFDPAASDFPDSLRRLDALVESGTALRYGALEMSPESLERADAVLPCYLVAETIEEPGTLLPGKLPGLRVIRVISAPHKAFIPDPASSGPSVGSFILGAGEDDESPFPPRGARSAASASEARADTVAATPAREEAEYRTSRQDSARAAPPPSSGLEDFSMPDLEADAFPSFGEASLSPLAPSSAHGPAGDGPPSPRKGILEESRAIDASLPEGISLPEIEEPLPESIRPEEVEAPGSGEPADSGKTSKRTGGRLPDSNHANGDGPEPGAEAKNDRDDGIRVSLAVKLIGIISLVILGALSGVVSLATFLFRSEIRNTIEESYLQVANSASRKFDADFRSLSDKAIREMQAFKLRDDAAGGLSPAAASALSRELFASESEILVVSAFPASGGDPVEIVNETALASLGVDPESARAAIAEAFERAKAAKLGESACLNVSHGFREPAILVTYPFKTATETGTLATAFLSRDRFQSAVATEKRTATSMSLVSQAGEILAHPDATRVAAPEPLSGSPEFTPLAASKMNGGSYEFPGEDGKRVLAYYAKVPSTGAWALVTVEEEKAFEAVRKVIIVNILIAVMVIAAAFLIIYFFSKTITVPLRELVDASKRIEEGRFHVKLKPRARDEVGLLMRSFVHMGAGLAERERLKDTFGKFVNKEVAERAAKGTLKLGGERKAVTIFFSDIRNFTSISESMEPEDVVDFLNKYMTRMVSCVNATGGNVDKYIGDAIMAVWGAPLAELSEAQYAERAINAALMMRKELVDFNRDRGGPRKPIIRIGCGINSGPVIVGQIGSTERLEYTVIGDAVNLASRIEALNKPFATDILVSERTYSLVRGLFRCEPMKPIQVKGKNESIQIYAVIGRADDPYAPATLDDVRSLVGMEHKDISGVDVDAEEVKYKIQPDGTGSGGRRA